MRPSVRVSQFLPSGPGALYVPPVHDVTLTLLNVTVVDDSGQVKTRTCDKLLWLPKYIVSPAPRVQRSEPFVVVEKKSYDSAPPATNWSSEIRNTTARCHVFPLNEFVVMYRKLFDSAALL